MKKIISFIICAILCVMAFASLAVSAADQASGSVAYKTDASNIDMTGTGDNFVVDPIWNSVPAQEFGTLKAGYTASGSAKFLWDGSNLYMLAEFKDSERSVGNSTINYNDCLEVRVYCNGSANGQYFRFKRDGADTGTWPNKIGNGVEVVYKDTADGWTVKYKLALNWAEVKGETQVKAAKELNMYVIYNDGKDGALAGQLQLMGGKNLITLSDEKVGPDNEQEDTSGDVQQGGSTENDTGTGNNNSVGGDTSSKDTTDTSAKDTTDTSAKDTSDTSASTTELDTTAVTDEGGCGSSIALGGIVAVTALSTLGVAVTSEKRRK